MGWMALDGKVWCVILPRKENSNQSLSISYFLFPTPFSPSSLTSFLHLSLRQDWQNKRRLWELRWKSCKGGGCVLSVYAKWMNAPLVPYPHRRCPAWTQKPKINNMTTGQNGGQIVVRLLGMQLSSHIHFGCTPCSTDSRHIKTQPTALSKDASAWLSSYAHLTV